MPLPDAGNTPWPPKDLEPINRRIAEWAAWYSGDTDQLAAIYGGAGATAGPGATGQFFGSETGTGRRIAARVRDTVRRWFWGNTRTSSQPRQRLHVPLAGDIAAASADLLFSEPPAFTVPPLLPDSDTKQTGDDPTQARLDELIDDATHATLLEAAEICAALGGVYLRVCWDPETVPDRPWLAAVHPDCAVPEWRFGRLQAVTFWRVIRHDKRTVVRHLERHEPGAVLHGVYEGDEDTLGMAVPLTDYPETEALAAGLVDGNVYPTGTDRLTARYIPNMRPNRVWRTTPGAGALGRSDYAGAEALLDSLDLTYSSWMRDVELGKARLIVPDAYLQSHGRGQGASVDLDREVYEPVNVMGGDEGSADITQVQFAIRVDEHQRTIADLKTEIVQSAGYSAQTFGLHGEAAVTATEVAARERRSHITRDRKTRYWAPELAEILEALLAVDAHLFRTAGIAPRRPLVEWPDAVSEDPLAVANTVEAWARAEAASIETRVRRLHPDWTDPQVDEEVARIRDEQGATTADPLGQAITDAARGRYPLDDQDDKPDPADADQGTPDGA